MLAREVWKEPRRATPLDNVIDVQMTRLRKKVDADAGERLIHTVRGVGFRPEGGRAMTPRWSTASIRVRLTGWYAVVLCLMLVVYATATFVAVRHEFVEQFDEQLPRRFRNGGRVSRAGAGWTHCVVGRSPSRSG